MNKISKLFVAACLGVMALDAAMDLKYMAEDARERAKCGCGNRCDGGQESGGAGLTDTDFADA